MNARYYVPEVGRFASPDTIVPDPMNPQSFNRYSYTNNNPINYTDPSGHRSCTATQAAVDFETCDQNNHNSSDPGQAGTQYDMTAWLAAEMVSNANVHS